MTIAKHSDGKDINTDIFYLGKSYELNQDNIYELKDVKIGD